MKKRTRAAQKRLNNLLLILLLTAVLLVMSTYAWFTANKTVNIDGIDLKVATSSGLQISADGKHWKTILDFNDLKNAYTTDNSNGKTLNQIPFVMAPVSSALEVNTAGHLNMFYGDMGTDLNPKLGDGNVNPHYGEATVNAVLAATAQGTDEVDSYKTGILNADGSLGANKGEYDAGYYMAFDIWLKDTVKSDAIYMTGSIKEATASTKGASNAMRVALVKGGRYENVANPEDETTIEEIQKLTTVGGKVYLWEPNNEKHTDKAKAHADNLFELSKEGDTDAPGNSRWSYASSPMTYDAFFTATPDPIAVSMATADKNADYLKTIVNGMNNGNVSFYSTASTATPNYNLGEFEAGATKYRMYIWMEGQDIDCQNDASGADMSMNFQFSLNSFVEGGTQTETPGETP